MKHLLIVNALKTTLCCEALTVIRFKVQLQEISTTSQKYFSWQDCISDNEIIQNHLHSSARDVFKSNKRNNLRTDINKK